MKNILIILLSLTSFYLQSQSLYPTVGAQCGAHGSGGCLHYQSPCPPEADALIHFVLRTDDAGQETSWQLFDMTDNAVVESGDKLLSNLTYDILVCAKNDHCYRLTINDTGNNGLDPDKGGYTLAFNGDVVAKGGVFTAMETANIGGCCSNLQVGLQGGVACYDAETGQLIASVTGGVAPYAFSWSTGATHTTTQWVSPGNDPVSVSVTDAAGCTAADTIEITLLPQLALSTQATSPSLYGASDGIAQVIPSGGIEPYSYLWSTGAITALATNLTAGIYSVTVHDASGCVGEQVVTVPEGASGAQDVVRPLEGLRLFPNPTTGRVTIVFRTPGAAKGTVSVFNSTGQIIQHQYFQAFYGENQWEMVLPQAPDGIYTVKVRVGQAGGSYRLVLVK